ncbi:tetratricopeptide repeat protein [Fulvivirgaceae bacterium BMA12]|uniref:Tetratricopeptide repeat protein n=1 Tax=Agaribacillus aureus TaxID=3051825 RepID=A0ABT8L2Q2_9BACT|nr:tetratricopeptide repeat protein [Fulvivirgaceae bacterium BMA12]
MIKYILGGLIWVGLVSCSPSEQELLNAGISKFETENYEDAVAYFDKALALNPKNIKTYNAKSFALFALKKYEKVVENNLEAIKFDSSDYKPYYNMANARLELNQVEAAIKDYAKALQIKPNEADIYLNRGTGYYRLGAYFEAIQDFNFAQKLDENLPFVFYNRAKTYLKVDSIDLAIEDLTKMVTMMPNHGEAHYWLGLSRILQGNSEEGCLSLKKSRAMGFKNATEAINKNCQ